MNAPSEPGPGSEEAHPPFAVTADLVVFTIRDDALQVVLVERGVEPYLGALALPGGFVRIDEDLDAAALRELQEETGLDLGADPSVAPTQLRTYGRPDRDPRMRVVSVGYVALVAELAEPVGGTDAARATLVEVSEALAGDLAFDHAEILGDGLERVRAQLEYTSIATRFCSDEFTIADLRRVYETVWGTTLDPANFRRKVLANEMVVPTDRPRRPPSTKGGRPAALFRAASVDPLPIDPPIRRPQPMPRPAPGSGGG